MISSTLPEECDEKEKQSLKTQVLVTSNLDHTRESLSSFAAQSDRRSVGQLPVQLRLPPSLMTTNTNSNVVQSPLLVVFAPVTDQNVKE